MKKKILQCAECMSLNYRLNNNNSHSILSVKKYCKHCKKHNIHKETK